MSIYRFKKGLKRYNLKLYQNDSIRKSLKKKSKLQSNSLLNLKISPCFNESETNLKKVKKEKPWKKRFTSIQTLIKIYYKF